MSKLTRQIRSERQARKRWRRQITYGMVALMVVVLGALILFAGPNGEPQIASEQILESQPESSQDVDHQKSKGSADAPVIVMEYGDFQ